MKRLVVAIICSLFLMPLASHAQTALAPQQNRPLAHKTASDPFEPFNRKVYQFNTVLDRFILKPVVKAYRDTVPAWGRERIADFLNNLATPVAFIDTALQGDGKQASIEFWRFILNSTYGLGGLFDFAGDYGLPDRPEDFGQTLGRYHIGQGPYLMLPVLGPSSVRDGVGSVVDIFLDPFNYLLSDEALIVRNSVNIIEKRSETLSLTDQIDRTSLDPYATIRSLYLQSREDLVSNGASGPDIDYQQ